MSRPAAVHPHLPRFAQAVTGVLSLEALMFQDRWTVAVALALVLVAVTLPRYSPVNAIFRLVARPADELEPVAPVRFAQMMALVGLAAGLALILIGAEAAGWVIVGIIAVVALFSAVTGICVGCAIYRLILVRSGHADDVREELGLTGQGPWLVVLTAPGCARCEPVARELADVAAPQAVTKIDLSRTPSAARLPVKSVPAILAVDGAGRIVRTLVGRLDRPVLEEAVAGL